MSVTTGNITQIGRGLRSAVLNMPAAKHYGFDAGHIAPGRVEIIPPSREELTQGDDFFPGGVPGALADFAEGSAAFGLLPGGWFRMPAECPVKLRTPATGDHTIARGRIMKTGRPGPRAGGDGPDTVAFCCSPPVHPRKVNHAHPMGPTAPA